ncbi:MAG: toxin TcdB middle/N-terminal domain-containing protein [Anaerolineae bacterium]
MAAFGLGCLLGVAIWAFTSGPALADDPPSKSGVEPQVINLPSGPGSIQGLGESFEPQLNTGTASYSIPLKLPPGAGGHAPSIALVYNSGWGNGPFGLGWRLDLPYVQRQTDKGLPEYTDADLFVHSSGEELVPLADKIYRFKVENAFTRFTRLDDGGWEATQRDGKRWLFGETAEGRQTNALGTFCWFPQRFIDTNDNEVRFFYSHHNDPHDRNLQVYLSEIRYNFDRRAAFGAEPAENYVSVRIEYDMQSRPDKLDDYRSRFRVHTAWRARAIEVQAQGEIVRRYELEYDDRDAISLLSEVHFLGRNRMRFTDQHPTQALPPLRLDYTPYDPTSARNVSMDDAPDAWLGNPNVDLVDTNGDALPDIVHTDSEKNKYFFYLNRGFGSRLCQSAQPPFDNPQDGCAQWHDEILAPSASPNAYLKVDGVQMADMDGNGLADLVAQSTADANGSFGYYPNQGDTNWELNSWVRLDTDAPLHEHANVRLVDLNNDKRIDILRTTPFKYYIYYNRPRCVDEEHRADEEHPGCGWTAGGDRRVTPLWAFGFKLQFRNTRVHLADMNGDRLQDMVVVTDRGIRYFPSRGMGDFGRVRLPADPTRPIGDEREAVTMDDSPFLDGRNGERLLADINGDGLADLLLVSTHRVYAWLNQAGAGYGEELTMRDVPQHRRDTVLRLADMNGDGATDLLYSTDPQGADPPAREDRFRYIDFTGGTVPHLLERIDNGLGRVIKLSYRSSTDYYVDDWNNGDQWTLRSPVPVTVVSRSTVTDTNSGQVYVTDYVYRNAYYDGLEKTFRGFALVHQIDGGDSSAPTKTQRFIFDTGATDESRKGLVLQQDVVGLGGTCGEDSPAATISAATQQVADPGLSACYSRTVNRIATRKLADARDWPSFSYIAQSDVLEYETTDTPRRKRKEFAYDEYGNVTQEFDYGEVAADGSKPELGGDERKTYISYAIDENAENAWIVDRVARVYQTDMKGNFVSEQRRYYDGPAFQGLALGKVLRGNLTCQEDNLGPAVGGHWQPTAGNTTCQGDAPGAGEHWVQSERYRYDPYGNQIARMDPDGVLDANGEPAPVGHWTKVGFDPVFHAYPVTETIHLAAGRALTVTADYDLGFGVITRTVDFNGHATLYTYDALARPTSIVKPGDSLQFPTQTFTYTLRNKVSSVETASREQFGTANVYRSISYVDGLGRTLQTCSEAEDGQVVVQDAVTFNLRGEVHEKYLPYYAGTPTLAYMLPETDKPKTTITYDPLLRQVKTTNPDRTFSRTVYRPLERLVYDEEDTDPASKQKHYDTPTTLRYDGLGRLAQVLERNGADTYTTTYGYDLLDNLTHIRDTEGNVKRQQFDSLSRKLWSDDPDRGLTKYVYDDVGNVLEMVDAKGQKIVYTYDGANRPLTENWVLAGGDTTPDIVYHYDADLAPEYADARNTRGRVTWVEDESGREYLSYDARGNLAGRIKRINVPGSSQVLDFATRMQYDAMDRLTELTYPDGATLQQRYNEQSLLDAIPGYVDDIDYIASGQREAVATADGVHTTYAYDERLRLEDLQSVAGTGAMLQAWHYEFDGVSNILRIEDRRQNLAPADDDTRALVLDDLYRLKTVTYTATAPQATINYDYDPIGNLTRKTSTLPAVSLGGLQYGQGAGPHVLTQVGNDRWQYDANGNLTAKPGYTYDWDFRDRLASVRGPDGLRQDHTFDHANARVAKRVSTTTAKTVLYPDRTVEVRGDQLVKYVFAGDERVAEVRTAFDPGQLVRGFSGAGSPLVGLGAGDSCSALKRDLVRSRWVSSSETTTFYHADHLGSATVLMNDQGNMVERVAYYPYGTDRMRSGASDVAYRFTDQEHDLEIGLYNYGARFYDPLVGRFISVDPLYMEEPEKGLEKPQALNLYAYAYNNPIRYHDPTGQVPIETVLDAADAAMSARDFYNEPSWTNAGFLGWSVAATFIPYVPGAWTAKGGKIAIGAFSKADAVVDIANAGRHTKSLSEVKLLPEVGRSGELTWDRLKHIVDRHWPNSTATGAGKFLPDMRTGKLRSMIRETLEKGAVKGNTMSRPGHKFKYDFGQQIGVTTKGKPATKLEVIRYPDGRVQTAYPTK